jgi:hypothetical protein
MSCSYSRGMHAKSLLVKWALGFTTAVRTRCLGRRSKRSTFAVDLGQVGPCAFVPDPGFGQDRGEGPGTVAGAVVGQHPLDFDPRAADAAMAFASRPRLGPMECQEPS